MRRWQQGEEHIQRGHRDRAIGREAERADMRIVAVDVVRILIAPRTVVVIMAVVVAMRLPVGLLVQPVGNVRNSRIRVERPRVGQNVADLVLAAVYPRLERSGA